MSLSPPLSTTLFSAALGALLVLSGCSADRDGSAMVSLNVTPVVGSSAFQPNQTFTVNGRAASLSGTRFYMSEVTLLHEDGREIVVADTPITVRAREDDGTEVQHTINDRIVLVRADEGVSTSSLGEIPSGRYTGMRFTLGIKGLDNKAAIEDFPATHPLSVQTPSMHWNWNSGYIFLRMDGLLDIDGDGTPDPAVGDPGSEGSGQWRMHLGVTANARTIQLNQAFEIDADDPQSINLNVDISKFAETADYNVAANRFCMTGGCTSAVDAFTSRMQSAFAFGGVTSN